MSTHQILTAEEVFERRLWEQRKACTVFGGEWASSRSVWRMKRRENRGVYYEVHFGGGSVSYQVTPPDKKMLVVWENDIPDTHEDIARA